MLTCFSRCLVLLACGLGLGACSSTENYAHTDSRPGLDLSGYHTYNFMDAVARNDSAFQNSGSNIFDLKRSVTRQLEARGFRQAASPDLWVNIGMTNERKVQTRETNLVSDPAPAYIGQRYYHWQAHDVAVGSYEQGTVTIELVDAARKELLWQGVTTSILSSNPSRTSKSIDQGVADVFAKLPASAPAGGR
ncbi:MAG: DUF4136 domain-containing protein [Janthinobacterium lividum]